MSDSLTPPTGDPTPEVPPTPAEPVAPASDPSAGYAAPAAPAYAASPAAAKNGLSTAAFVLGIVGVALAVLGFIPFAGLFFFDWIAILAGIAAIILGVLGQNRAKQTGVGASRGRTGLILGIVAIVLSIIAVIVGIVEIAALGQGIIDQACQQLEEQGQTSAACN